MGEGGGGSTCQLSVKVSLLCRLSVNPSYSSFVARWYFFFSLCRQSVVFSSPLSLVG